MSIEAKPVQPNSLAPTDRPAVRIDGDWVEENLTYLLRPRPKAKFRTVLDANDIIPTNPGGHSTLSTRVRSSAKPGEVAMRIEVCHGLKLGRITETFNCVQLEGGGVRSGVFERMFVDRDGEVLRQEHADLRVGIGALPTSTYPEVMLPYVLRGQPPAKKQALYAWISDRMIARMYYEARSKKTVEVPAGSFSCYQVWMYPDLNDWVRMGAMLTKLAKPLLPRYMMDYELAPPHRLIRFEGAYGPPGAPEVVVELADPI